MATNNSINLHGPMPAFAATHSVDQTMVYGTSTASFDTVEFNITSSYNNSTYTFTAPLAGYYMLGFNGILEATTTGKTLATLVTTQGSYDLSEYSGLTIGSGAYDKLIPLCASAPCIMSVGDTAYIQISTNVGGGSVLYKKANSPLFYGYLLALI